MKNNMRRIMDSAILNHDVKPEWDGKKYITATQWRSYGKKYGYWDYFMKIKEDKKPKKLK